MAVYACPFCNSGAPFTGDACAACGRSLVLLGRFKLLELQQLSDGFHVYVARDTMNPYASNVEAWVTRQPSALSIAGALTSGSEDGGYFVVIRAAALPPPAAIGAYGGALVGAGAAGVPRRRSGAGCVIAIAVLGIGGAGLGLGIALFRSDTGGAISDIASNTTTCNKSMTLGPDNYSQAIVAGDGCDLVIADSNLNAAKPLVARGHAKVHIQSCNVNALSPAPAIEIHDQAVVTVSGSNVGPTFAADVEDQGLLTAEGSIFSGRVVRGDNATLTGVDENPPRPAVTPSASAAVAVDAAPPPTDWGAYACAGVVDCYKQAQFHGHVSGKLTVLIATNGHATSAFYSGGYLQGSIQSCLVANGRATTLDGYSGPTGRLTCEWDGTIMGGSEEMMQDSNFTADPVKKK